MPFDTPEDSQIYRTYNALRNSRVAYPKGPQLEIEKGLDEIKMGNPLIVGTSPSWADIGADVDAIADWEEFLQKDGSRGFTISRTDISEYKHEKEWSASGTIYYKIFFSTQINASEHIRTEQSVKDIMTVSFNFTRISEVWIRRGSWYDSSIFSLPRIKKILDKDKKLASNLRYSVASLLVGRGFSMSISFEHDEHYDYFRNQQVSGNAKLLNIFSIGSGSVNERSTEMKENKATKTITFSDDKELVRLIGFKVDEMHQLSTDLEALSTIGVFPSPKALQEYLVTEFNLQADYFA